MRAKLVGELVRVYFAEKTLRVKIECKRDLPFKVVCYVLHAFEATTKETETDAEPAWMTPAPINKLIEFLAEPGQVVNSEFIASCSTLR